MAEPKPPTESEIDLDRALLELEDQLATFKARYLQVQQDQAEKLNLLEQQKRLKHSSKTPQVRSELTAISQRLEELEFHLESSLFSWKSMGDWFWQAVRFLGLGIVIGWWLRSL
ncbi:MAG: hypothetical protein HC916_01985 [Coleofasciculaceae cyanobacterium SM2_1_6]|nr:hypothetical protein [Coleofasciculaceae cyanobacterium SM2_1_6]